VPDPYQHARLASAQLLSLWSIFTFLLFVCTLALNAALSVLFSLLGLTFALLAAGVQHETTDKAAGAPEDFDSV
jgi:succinate-acetate transporter protein